MITNKQREANFMSDFISDSQIIEGVQIANLQVYADARGQFMEMFRREWFPQVNWERTQSNRSQSKAGVLRGLHYHFQQVDYWHVVQGTIRAGLVDLRPHSPTHKAAQLVELSADKPLGLFVPVGVAHGFYAVTDCILIYFVNNYYDSSDEHGVAWDDPEIGLAWGAEAPLISQRDATNPRMKDIPAQAMPAT